MPNNTWPPWVLLLSSLLLFGCGGGGGSSASSATYTVGGSISGLTASGLVLLENGGSALTIPADASSFSFPTAAASGSTYAVTVQTQPTGQSCSVSNGSGTLTADVTGVSVSCGNAFAAGGKNVATVSVLPGPADLNDQTFNIPLTSVTVCEPGTDTCATINNVLVDTGSSGLRLMASVLASNGLTLTPMPDPRANGNTIHECEPFADGYSWGAVASAGVSIGAESAGTIPVQVIDDSATPSPAAPGSCTSNGSPENTVDDFDANGVLGLGVFIQDCGPGCAQTASYDVYYSCTSGGNCSPTTQSLADQVSNPVASFPIDNNGVIVQLPSIPAIGAATASGYLVFGIGTESNNGLGGATVLTADDNGDFSTSFNGQTLSNSFIDSGSNALFFNDSSIALCGTSGGAADFYCPSTTLNLSATNQGGNGTSSSVSFQVANLNDINDNYFAIDDAAGPAAPITGVGSYFDWGLSFFYGRTVFIAIQSTTIGGANGAYAY